MSSGQALRIYILFICISICICVFVIYYIYLIFVSSASGRPGIQIRVRPEFEPKSPVVVVLWLGSPRRVCCALRRVCVAASACKIIYIYIDIYINAAPQHRLGIGSISYNVYV